MRAPRAHGGMGLLPVAPAALRRRPAPGVGAAPARAGRPAPRVLLLHARDRAGSRRLRAPPDGARRWGLRSTNASAGSTARPSLAAPHRAPAGARAAPATVSSCRHTTPLGSAARDGRRVSLLGRAQGAVA